MSGNGRLLYMIMDDIFFQFLNMKHSISGILYIKSYQQGKDVLAWTNMCILLIIPFLGNQAMKLGIWSLVIPFIYNQYVIESTFHLYHFLKVCITVSQPKIVVGTFLVIVTLYTILELARCFLYAHTTTGLCFL
jgi:hypothetical protein